MNKTWIVACALFLVSVAGFAETPSPAPLTPEALAAILSESTPGGACAAQQSEVVFAARKPRVGQKALCSATANCGSGTTVSCSSNVSASSCTAVDRNCSAGERGHVICDGVRTDCPCPCGGTIREQACCQCDQTGDCFQCCRCDGFGVTYCARACSY